MITKLAFSCFIFSLFGSAVFGQTDDGLKVTHDLGEVMVSWTGQTVTDESLKDIKGVKARFGSKKLPARLWVTLDNSKITDAGIEFLSKTSFETMEITSLSIKQTAITDAALVHLKKIETLTSLFLDETNIGDDGLLRIREIESLFKLDLDGTKISDTGLKHLYDMPNLRVLSLCNLNVSDAGIDALQKARPNIEILRDPRVDGVFDDWQPQHVKGFDKRNDASGAFDIHTVFARTPGPEVFLYFKLQKSVNLHGGNDADGKLYLNFDLGKKGKLQINLQARNATLTSDKNVSQIPWSKLDFSCLPTTASDSYELQINFSELGLVEGDKIMLDFSGSDSLKRPVAIVIGAK